MKVWIDQDLCTGDGLCEEIAPDVFTLLDDGLAYVKEGDRAMLKVQKVSLISQTAALMQLLSPPRNAPANASLSNPEN